MKMQQDEQASRYDMNRNTKVVLTRHDADLTRIDYSFMGNTAYLYGDLVKPDGDYSVQGIETIAREISALSHVREIQFNLNNWMVMSSGDSWQIIRTRKPIATTAGAAHQTGSSDGTTIVIKKAEKLTDVLKDLKAGSKKEEEKKVA